MDKTRKLRQEKESEIERLEVECLLRSEKFREIWKVAYESATKNKPFLIPENLQDNKIIRTLLNHKPFFLMDPEKASFTEYTAIKNQYIQELREAGELPGPLESVEDYRPIFFQDFDIAVDSIRKKYNRDPTIDELRESLTRWMAPGYQVFLKITQREFTFKELDEIEKKINNILSKRIPRKRFMREEMERYLRVYDLRMSGKKYKEICQEVFPNHADSEGARLAAISDFKKAKRMIAHVETGGTFE